LSTAAIAGTGFYVPEKIITNADLKELVDTSDEWITERTGMKERRMAAEDQATSDLAFEAARRALADADVKGADLDMIVVGTVTGDMHFPSTACLLQARLGAKHAAAMDVAAGCTGFLYALETARSFIATGDYKNVLVIGAELLTRIVDWTDRGTCVLLGDGAGAVVLKPSSRPDRGILAGVFGADGSRMEDLWMPAGGSRLPPSEETIRNRQHYLRMNGNAIFKVAVRSMAHTVVQLLDKIGAQPSDISLLIPHQANLRIIEAVAKQLKFGMDRVFVNIHKYANCSSATTPIALDEARREGRIKPGDLVIMVAFGAGLTWGGVAIRW
jgi:3-oxoacyl-[acyl-carrier-protein] synthase-3